MMVVVMNFEHHLLDGATNITVLTDHQTLKGCLTPNLNERQTHLLISFHPTIFTFSLKRSIDDPFDGDQSDHSTGMPGKLDIRLQVNLGKSFSCLCEISFLACLAPPGPWGKECIDDVARRELEIGMWPPYGNCLKGVVVLYHSTTAPVDDRADF